MILPAVPVRKGQNSISLKGVAERQYKLVVRTERGAAGILPAPYLRLVPVLPNHQQERLVMAAISTER